MKLILVIFTLIASAIYPFYASAQETLPSTDFPDMRRGEQSKVTDAIGPLTLLLKNGQIIRLSGIHIPNSHGDEASPLAVTARDILKDMFAGQRVQLYQTKDKNMGLRNRMGHTLVHLERLDDNAWAQGTLLALGLAQVKTSPSNAHMTKEMLLLESKAREEKLGIWQDAPILTSDNANEGIGAFSVIEGTIESVALKKNRIYINFGKDWKTDFTVSIAPEDKRKFSKAKLAPLNWGGKRIRVRGSVREYNGPYMELTHPEAVEFIEE